MDIKMIILLALLVAGILMALASFSRKIFRKPGAMKVFFGIFAVAFVVYAVVGIGAQMAWWTLPVGASNFFLASGVQYVPPAGGGYVPPVVSGCNVEDTTVTISALDEFTGSALGGVHRYSVNGAPWATLTDGNTATLSPGDKVSILYGNANWSDYFGVYKENLVVPCAGTHTFFEKTDRNGTSMTIQVFNEENALTSTTAETIVANEQVTLEAKLKSTSQAGYPLGGIIVVDYASANWDKVEYNFGGSEVAVPTAFGQFPPTLINATSHTFKAFSFPSIKDDEILIGTLTLDAKNYNVNNGGNISTYVFANNYYIDEDDGSKIKLGVEDEDDALTKGQIQDLFQNSTFYSVQIA